MDQLFLGFMFSWSGSVMSGLSYLLLGYGVVAEFGSVVGYWSRSYSWIVVICGFFSYIRVNLLFWYLSACGLISYLWMWFSSIYLLGFQGILGLEGYLIFGCYGIIGWRCVGLKDLFLGCGYFGYSLFAGPWYLSSCFFEG